MNESLKNELDILFGDLLETPLPARVRLNIIFGRTNYGHDDVQQLSDSVTNLFEVGAGEGKNSILRSIVLDKGSIPMNGAPNQPFHHVDKLSRILQDYISVEADEEVFVITWDHGSSFGIFRSESKAIKATHFKSIEEELRSYPNLKSFWEATADPGSNEAAVISGQLLQEEAVTEIMSNDELSDIFQEWLKGKKVGVLLMMNCWMMNLHSIYSYKDTVKCFVAPQGGIDFPGYYMKGILEELYLSDPVPSELAKVCVEQSDSPAAIQRIRDLRIDPEEGVLTWKIFAIDLEATDKGKRVTDLLFEILRDIIGSMHNELDNLESQASPGYRYLLLYSRAICFPFSGRKTFMIDIPNWLNTFWPANDINLWKFNCEIDQKISALNTLIERLRKTQVFYLKSTEASKLHSETVYYVKAVSTGLSLFFPIGSDRKLPNVLDNVKKDRLLNEKAGLPLWKPVLRLIDRNNQEY